MKTKRISSAVPNAYTLLKADLGRLFRSRQLWILFALLLLSSVSSFFISRSWYVSGQPIAPFQNYALLRALSIFFFALLLAGRRFAPQEYRRKLTLGFTPGQIYCASLTETALSCFTLYIAGSFDVLFYLHLYPVKIPLYLTALLFCGLIAVFPALLGAGLNAAVGSRAAATLLAVLLFFGGELGASYTERRIERSTSPTVWGQIEYEEGETGPTAGYVPNPYYLEEAQREKLDTVKALIPCGELRLLQKLEINHHKVEVPELDITISAGDLCLNESGGWADVGRLSHSRVIVGRAEDFRTGAVAPRKLLNVAMTLFPAGTALFSVPALAVCFILFRRRIGKTARREKG